MINKNITAFSICVIMLFAVIFIYDFAFADDKIVELLWQNGIPDNSIVHENEESIENRTIDQNELGLNRSISNVSMPSLTVYPAPKSTSTGAAVIIFPGGGYSHLAIDKEGYDVAKWLNTIGVTGVIVKYRTCPSSVGGRGLSMPENIMNAIISDGQRAVRLVRSMAEKWGIDPDRIGIMGFSAGGHLAVTLTTNYDKGQKNAMDPVDRVSCKPDFTGLIYSAIPKNIESLINEDTSPLFFVNAGDDKTTPADNSIRLYQALRKANIQTEIHIYIKGGHGFGLGVRGGAVTSWPERFADWMREMKFLSQ